MAMTGCDVDVGDEVGHIFSISPVICWYPMELLVDNIFFQIYYRVGLHIPS